MQQIVISDIAKRSEDNPILTPDEITPGTESMTVRCLLNPGVFRYEKKIWLLVRVAEGPAQADDFVRIPVITEFDVDTRQFSKNDPDLDDSNPEVVIYKDQPYQTTFSHFRLMNSDDGVTFQEAEGYPPIFGMGPLEAFSIEDCRVTEINSLYYLTYTMISPHGVGVGLIQTRDWKHFDRRGMILPPYTRECAIFEEKIHGKYFALHSAGTKVEGDSLWLAESPDLVHWGNHKCIATPRKNHWDSARIGTGAGPIQIPKGWLLIYYGTDENNRYCLGALLLDSSDPSKVIGRSEFPIMEPTTSYELSGFVNNKIFTNGHLVIGDRVQLYYAAGNEVICRAELSIQEILKTLS